LVPVSRRFEEDGEASSLSVSFPPSFRLGSCESTSVEAITLLSYPRSEVLTLLTYSHYLPESPRYDVIRGREDLARQTMRLVYTDISDDIIELKLNSIRETVNLSRTFQERWPVSKRPFIMFKTGAYRRPLIAACGIMAYQQLSGFNSLLCRYSFLGSLGGYRASERPCGDSGGSALTFPALPPQTTRLPSSRLQVSTTLLLWG
jgi:hypothetical protein